MNFTGYESQFKLKDKFLFSHQFLPYPHFKEAYNNWDQNESFEPLRPLREKQKSERQLRKIKQKQYIIKS